MVVDIFIRTYRKDLPWLPHALRSINEKVTGYRQIVICIPAGQGHLLQYLTTERVVEVPDLRDGYVGQQMTKLEAYKYSSADVICFWDSDTVAAEPIDLTKLITTTDGRLIMHHVPYSGLSDGSQVWQKVVERDMGDPVMFEFMRRLPLAYHRSTLIGCVRHIEGKHSTQLATYMSRVPLRSFTEFNCAGAWAYANERDKYDWRIDEDEVAQWKQKVRQFWSWGGITADVQAELDKL